MYIPESNYATEEWLTGADSGLSSAKKDDKLGRNQFLQLLVAQLQHQDPLNPLDGTDFSAQLAQFSSLEQMFNMNDSLANIQQSLDAQNENVLDYIGKTVRSGENKTIIVNDGQTAGGSYYTLGNRAEVIIRIYDSDGFKVCQLYPGWKDPGEYAVDWNGTDYNGDTVSDGEYTCAIEARNEKGFSVPVATSVAGEVTGVTYNNEKAFLIIGSSTAGNRLIEANNIIEVNKTVAAQQE